MRRVLVTGGNGFVGQWLTKALLAAGDEVTVTGLEPAGHSATRPLGHSAEAEPPPRRAAELPSSRLHWLATDMRDSAAVDQAIETTRPDAIVHLAGISFPPEAEREPVTTYDVNVLGAIRLLAAVTTRRKAGVIDPVVLIVGSGAQYGRHAESAMPLAESAAQMPLSIYAASKAAQEVAALQMHRESGVKVICARSFNHSGAGQTADYVIPSLVARALRIRSGADRTLRLGNDVVRDYLHVDEVVQAYLRLLETGTPGEAYNVASGHGVSVRQLAADVLLRVGATADISTDVALQRATDVPVLVGSHAKLTNDTGWAPQKTYLDIIDDVIRFALAPAPASEHAATD
jgi:GDP-4-dehydro-6-deoxy-D-mannose reductase